MERLAESVIVPAGPGDAAALAEVHVKAWRETYVGLLPALYLERMSAPVHARRWRRQLANARADDVVLAAEGPVGLTAYCAGALVGGEIARRESEVFTLYLLKAAQGGGLGRRLFETAAKVLQAKGARSLKLWVLNGNERARGFYDHLGGVAVDERPVSGWGGGLLETAYRWSDIGALTRA
ncbi:MAG TPA: GNAT family N-acetyltransferase [Caulobacteraceae bacterium]|jgi:GNAT superfamily N-acetyltransferase